MAITNTPLQERAALYFRLIIGAAFGLAISFLIDDSPNKLASSPEPSIWRDIFAQSLGLLAFVLWAGASAMRRISLLVWGAVSFALVLLATWHFNVMLGKQGDSEVGIFLLLAFLFIAHELVSSGDQANGVFAPYETYFDEAWKRGVQLALAIGFTLLFWAILWMGAALLGFIGFKWLDELLKDRHFALPLTGLAFASAVQLGDVQPKLLANVRGLVLGVLSWLLPVITVIGIIFAVSLLFSGLQPLWDTKAATATLLSGCIGFVLLINAAYQQGDEERKIAVVLKWCVRLASILLLIFAILAAWSLGLRILQYGLTSDRVLAGMTVVIALAYGVGYVVAVFWPGRWMGLLEPLNIRFAVLKVVLFLAVLTPFAAPARLSVEDQVARLNSGKIAANKFDWWFLLSDAGLYGTNALDRLTKSNNKDIANWAVKAKKGEIGERPYRDFEPEPVKPEDRPNLALIPVVSPKSAKLPASFLAQDFASERDYDLPSCLRTNPKEGAPLCWAALLDVDRDRQPEILILAGIEITILKQVADRWVLSGNLCSCDNSVAEDFKAGKIRVVPPLVDDVEIGNRHLQTTFGVEPFSEVKAAVAAPSDAAPTAPAPSKP